MNFFLAKAHSKTGFLRSKDRTALFYRHYAVDDKKASIFLIHGFGEHSGRYSHVIAKLKSEGYEVFCIDFRGHGHSKGTRGDINDFCLYEEDVLSGLHYIQNNLSQGKKLFILAHSLGALVSLRAVVRSGYPVDGMVLSCPLFGLKMPVPSWKKWGSFAMARLLPQIRVSSGIKGCHLSSDHDAARAYDNDPLVLKNLSVRASWEIFKGYQNAHALARRISLPLFLQVAGADPVVDSKASEKWFSQVDQKKVDASLKVYPGFLHEIYNETGRMEAIEDFVRWLRERT